MSNIKHINVVPNKSFLNKILTLSNDNVLILPDRLYNLLSILNFKYDNKSLTKLTYYLEVKTKINTPTYKHSDIIKTFVIEYIFYDYIIAELIIDNFSFTKIYVFKTEEEVIKYIKKEFNFELRKNKIEKLLSNNK